MTIVVGTALRRALASLVLCFGLAVLVFTVMARTSVAGFYGDGFVVHFPRSQWDVPLAVGVAAASLLVAGLIYPARRPRWRLLPDRQDRRAEDDLRVLQR